MPKFDLTKEYTLENERVRLRPLTKDDVEHLATFSINEPELWTYSLQQGSGLENLKTYIQTALDDRSAGKSYPFIVWDKQANTYVGSTRFYDYQAIHQTVQLGYTWYGKSFQGTGINKQCKFLMLQLAFEELELFRVEFRADNNNQRSIAAMKSIGCVPEGVLRLNCASPTGRRDSIILSVLKSEWESTVRQRLLEKIEVESNR